MTTPREPLSQEERALAQRLAAHAGAREPGPALDARILAAARAAAESEATANAEPSAAPPQFTATPVSPVRARARRRGPTRRRWTLGAGVAASLVLAVTIAWQLRPQRDRQIIYEVAQAPAEGSAAPAAGQLEVPPAMDAAPADEPAVPAPAKVSPALEERSSPMAVPPPAAPRIAEVAPPPAVEPPAPPPPAAPVADGFTAPARPKAFTQMDTAPAPRPADTYTPPAPPSPPAPVPQAMPAYAPAPSAPMPDVGVDAAPASKARAERAAANQAASSARRVERLSERYAPSSPPAALAPAGGATPSDPALQAAVDGDRHLPAAEWLQRIRRHRFEGNGALARASLQAFQQAHPDQDIPEDLRPLLP